MSQISAEKLDSVSHSPPPGSSESLLHLFHLNYPEIQTRQQMSGFLNDHQIPEILARSIENGLLPTNGVRTELLFRQPLGEVKPQEIVVRSPSGSADSNIRTVYYLTLLLQELGLSRLAVNRGMTGRYSCLLGLMRIIN